MNTFNDNEKKYGHHLSLLPKERKEAELSSQQSVLDTINYFINCTIKMDSTILIPTKLKDITEKDVRCKLKSKSMQNECLDEHHLIADGNLYCLYQMLSEIRTKLVSSNYIISQAARDILKHFNINCQAEFDQLSYHVQSLSLILNELAHLANYITYRYQQEMER